MYMDTLHKGENDDDDDDDNNNNNSFSCMPAKSPNPQTPILFPISNISSSPHLDLQSRLFSSGFPTIKPHTLSFAPMRATSLTHLLICLAS
jgi:hypothetical protein